jgi:Ca-activated chloride channel family protein
MRFASPLFLLLLLVPAAYLWRRWRARRRAPAERLAFPALQLLLAAPRTTRTRWRWVPAALKVTGMSLAIAALARPQTAVEVREIRSRARNIMVALDISSSMKAGDFQPGNRLEVARRVLAEFVRRREGDLVGLVIFSGRAFLQAPLNADPELLGRLIDRVEIGMLPDGTAIGTAIGTALALSLSQLKDLPPKASVVILITDGANNTGEPTPLAAAEAARALGVRVHAIGLSTADTTAADGPFIWREGRQPDRLTSSDEAVLRRLTGRTGGQYYRATDPDALDRILRDIDPVERTDVRIAEVRDHREWFPLFLSIGLLLLALESFLGATWLRRLP